MDVEAITHEEMQSSKRYLLSQMLQFKIRKQIKSSEARQKQIELNRKRKVKDKFQKSIVYNYELP